MLGRSPERAPVNRPILRWLRIVSDRLETLAVQLAAQLEDQRDEPVRACDGRATRAAKAQSSAVLKQANWKWDSNSERSEESAECLRRRSRRVATLQAAHVTRSAKGPPDSRLRRGRFGHREQAGERARTVDIQLGKLTLYQLSYTREVVAKRSKVGRGGEWAWGVGMPSGQRRQAPPSRHSLRPPMAVALSKTAKELGPEVGAWRPNPAGPCPACQITWLPVGLVGGSGGSSGDLRRTRTGRRGSRRPVSGSRAIGRMRGTRRRRLDRSGLGVSRHRGRDRRTPPTASPIRRAAAR